MRNSRILIVGGGASGYFSALASAENASSAEVTIVEAGRKPLQKVAISGGGRCNVTHNCFDLDSLRKSYPRGSKELRSPFTRFQPRDTIAWFEKRGVSLKSEADGRMFPTTDTSQTIIDCFERERKKLGVSLRLGTKVTEVSLSGRDGTFNVTFKDGRKENYTTLFLATGGLKSGHAIAESLGHTITPCAPSLFTFEVKDPRIKDLSGLSVSEASVHLSPSDGTVNWPVFRETGPLLITHWGFSGPSVIRLSAWAALELKTAEYSAKLTVNWAPDFQTLKPAIDELRNKSPKKQVLKTPLIGVPKRLWSTLCQAAGISMEQRFADLSKASVKALESQVFRASFKVSGKGVFKEEFVTCGGVSLKEVDLRTMQSKKVPGLYFCGEILDIDGITGGFNFQSAWTTAHIAGKNLK